MATATYYPGTYSIHVMETIRYTWNSGLGDFDTQRLSRTIADMPPVLCKDLPDTGGPGDVWYSTAFRFAANGSVAITPNTYNAATQTVAWKCPIATSFLAPNFSDGVTGLTVGGTLSGGTWSTSYSGNAFTNGGQVQASPTLVAGYSKQPMQMIPQMSSLTASLLDLSSAPHTGYFDLTFDYILNVTQNEVDLSTTGTAPTDPSSLTPQWDAAIFNDSVNLVWCNDVGWTYLSTNNGARSNKAWTTKKFLGRQYQAGQGSSSPSVAYRENGDLLCLTKTQTGSLQCGRAAAYLPAGKGNDAADSWAIGNGYNGNQNWFTNEISSVFHPCYRLRFVRHGAVDWVFLQDDNQGVTCRRWIPQPTLAGNPFDWRDLFSYYTYPQPNATTGVPAWAVVNTFSAAGTYDGGWFPYYTGQFFGVVGRSGGTIKVYKSSNPEAWNSATVIDTTKNLYLASACMLASGVIVGLTWNFGGDTKCKACRSYDGGLTWEFDAGNVSVIPALTYPPQLIAAHDTAVAVWEVADVPALARSMDAGNTWM